MAQFLNMYTVELNDGAAPVVSLKQIHQGNHKANRVGARVVLDGQPYTLGGNCSGTAILADGSTVPLTGTVSGNECYVELDNACYQVEGQIHVFVSWVSGQLETTLLAAVGTVRFTQTGNVIQPSTPVPDLAQLMAQITAMQEATAAANAAATKAVRYDSEQTLTAAQMAQARTNILAASQTDVTDLIAAMANNGLATQITDGWIAGKRMEIPAVGVAVSDIQSSNDNWRYIKIPCSPGDQFVINAQCGQATTYRVWAFVDSALTVLERDDGYGAIDELITAPSNAAYLYINQNAERGYCYRGNYISDRVSVLSGLISMLSSTVSEHADALEKALSYKGKAKSADYEQLLSKIIDQGMYYLDRNGAAGDTGVFNDRPEDSSGTAAVLLVYPVLTTFALQNLIDVSGNNFWRYVYRDGSGKYVPSGLTADANGWFLPRQVQRAIDANDQLSQQIQALSESVDENAEAIAKSLSYKGAAKSADYTARLSNVTDTGIYYLNRQAAAAGVYDDRPVDSTGSAAVLLVYPVLNAFALQNLIDVSGNNYWRYITLSTKEPYIPSGLTADANGWFLPRHLQQAMTDIAALRTDTDALISRQRWAGKTIVFFGDSRTWYDGEPYPSTAKSEYVGKICVGYQQQCIRLLGITAINQGDSGKNTSEISQNIIAYGNGFKNVDAVYISGGVNDFILSRSRIGELDTDGGPYDTGTAYGGLQTAIEWLMTNYPKMKIFVEVPPIAWRGENGDVYPYATACLKRDVAEFYNLPCVDLYKTCGINKINRSEYYADDPDPAKTNYWYLHFNDYGNERLGQIVAEFINTH